MKEKFTKIFRKLTEPEVILYIIFGMLTTIENIVLFKLLSIQLDYRAANLITLIVVKMTAYVCNKKFVFKSKTENMAALLKEFGRYAVTRGGTMLIDYFGLIFLVSVMQCDALVGKCIVTVIVIVLNYFMGKKIVFVGRQKEKW